MSFQIELEYTAFSPQAGVSFTEQNFVRRGVPFTFEVGEIGVALVDLWNFGWDDGPMSATLGPDLSFERGRSHALRKRQITEDVIAPTVNLLRGFGVQIFHCNHGRFLEGFPQWEASITPEERQAHWEKANPKTAETTATQEPDWQTQHRTLVLASDEWGMKQRNELYPQIALPALVQPKGNDLLVCERDQFHRLMAERGVRVLFYMGFETDCCLVHNQEYGMAKMTGPNCLCAVVRDGTTTYEAAETLEGLWRTRAALIDIETGYGYSIISAALLDAVRKANA